MPAAHQSITNSILSGAGKAEPPSSYTPPAINSSQAAATAGIAPTDTVYLYCFKGARASNTFLALKQAGFSDVRMYFGSWNEWSRDPALPIDDSLPLAGSALKKAA